MSPKFTAGYPCHSASFVLDDDTCFSIEIRFFLCFYRQTLLPDDDAQKPFSMTFDAAGSKLRKLFCGMDALESAAGSPTENLPGFPDLFQSLFPMVPFEFNKDDQKFISFGQPAQEQGIASFFILRPMINGFEIDSDGRFSFFRFYGERPSLFLLLGALQKGLFREELQQYALKILQSASSVIYSNLSNSPPSSSAVASSSSRSSSFDSLSSEIFSVFFPRR